MRVVDVPSDRLDATRIAAEHSGVQTAPQVVASTESRLTPHRAPDSLDLDVSAALADYIEERDISARLAAVIQPIVAEA